MSDPPKLYTAGMTIETNQHDGEGTIGGFAQDAKGKTVLVSCSHVLFTGFAALPTLRVYSPDYSSTCCGGDPIGTPVFDPNKAAVQDGDGGWVGGYHDGTWTGGFNAVPARLNIRGANVPGHASETDCAIAKLDAGIHFQNVWQVTQDGTTTTIPIKGAVSSGLGIGKGPNFGTAPNPDQYVRVYSDIHKRVQFGTMLSTPPDIPHVDDPDHLLFRYGVSDPSDAAVGAKPMVNQFIFLPRPTPDPKVSYVDSYQRGEELTIKGGESGSFIINNNNEVVAMLVARVDPSKIGSLPMDKMELAQVKYFGLASPIAPILANLNITIPTASGGWSGVAPAAGSGRLFVGGVGLDPAAVARRRVVARLSEELRGSVRGRLLLGKIGQHRREVRRLLTTVRPIAAAWRALGGAAYYHHCLRSLERSGHRIPTNINGVGRAQLVATMLPLFAQYGSDALRRDIDRYAPLFTNALLDIESLMDVAEALARPGARV